MINYTLKQLYSLEAVVRLKSFTKAAKELNITQPAVYMQLKHLQKNLGVELIRIDGKVVNATFIGNKFYQSAEQIIQQLEQAQLEIAAATNPESGHLQIAVATTTNSFSSGILVKFKQTQPNMSFHLEVTNRKTLLDKLLDNKIDLAIMGKPPENLPLQATAFMENPLIAIVHPKHPLLKNKNNSIETVNQETLITREQGSGTRTTVERLAGLEFTSDIEINSNEAIIEAVQAGLGIGFVSKHTVQLELKNDIIRQLSVENFPIIRNWYVVHNNKNALSPIAERFKKFVLANGV